jgi:hypothetical protein
MFLSIDLDAWNNVVPSAEQGLLQMLCIPTPIAVVSSHHHLLPFVDAVKSRHLVNLDWHDDILSEEQFLIDGETHCGNWINAVRWKDQGQYTWLRIQRNAFHGYCDGPSVWEEHYSTGWKSINKSRIQDISDIPLRQVEVVGISISPSYLSSNETAWGFLEKIFGSFKSALKEAKYPIEIIREGIATNPIYTRRIHIKEWQCV